MTSPSRSGVAPVCYAEDPQRIAICSQERRNDRHALPGFRERQQGVGRAAFEQDVGFDVCQTARRIELHAHRVARLQQQQWMGRKAADVDHFAGSNVERWIARGQDLVRQQRVAREGGIDTLIVPDAQVHVAAFQQGHLGGSKRLGQFDLHVGKARSVSRQECRQDALDHLRRGRHLQHATVAAPEQLHPLAQRADLTQDAAAVSEQLLADRSQDEAAPNAIEEPDAELLLEIADVSREG